MIGVALVSTVLLAIIATGSINAAYYATFTRLSGLLLGSAMAFFFAPYQIRGRARRGARLALDLAGRVGLFVLVLVVPRLHVPGFLPSRVDRSRVPRRLPARRPRDPARDRRRRCTRRPTSGPMLGWRPLRWIGLRSYSLYLWHYPIFCVTRPRVDFDGFFHLHGWPVFVVAARCCRSVRPSSRTASSRRRSAAARSAGTAIASAPRTASANGCSCGAVLVAASLSLVAVDARRRARERATADRAHHRPDERPRRRTTSAHSPRCATPTAGRADDDRDAGAPITRRPAPTTPTTTPGRAHHARASPSATP